MADMTAIDYATMIEDSHVETRLVEYRPLEKNADGEQPLIAACLTDLLPTACRWSIPSMSRRNSSVRSAPI